MSLDPNWQVSLFASGIPLPIGGFIYRPVTNDLLVNAESSLAIFSVNATTGAATVFATLPQSSCPINTTGCLQDLNINSSGQVYVPVSSQNEAPIQVYRFSSTGALVGSFLSFQGGAAFDSQDNFYVSGSPPSGGGGCCSTIYKYPAGTFASPSVFATGFSELIVIRFNVAGKLIGTDRAAGTVYQITPGGTASTSLVLASGLNSPDGVAIDPLTQDVFVGGEAGIVTHITAPGVFSTFATGFTEAEGMGFDSSGNLYVGDKEVGAIWKFTRTVPGGPLKIHPNQGGNAGSVTALITGGNIQAGATIRLTGSGAQIPGTNASTPSASALTATFNLQGAPVGLRDVVITNPDGSILRLTGGFTVVQGGAPQLWANIVGFTAIRFSKQQPYYITYGNRGTVDALGGHVIISFPSTLGLTLGFGNEVGVVSTSTVGTNTIVTVNVGRVSAGASVALPVLLTAAPSQPVFNIQASISSQ